MTSCKEKLSYRRSMMIIKRCARVFRCGKLHAFHISNMLTLYIEEMVKDNIAFISRKCRGSGHHDTMARTNNDYTHEWRNNDVSFNIWDNYLCRLKLLINADH